MSLHKYLYAHVNPVTFVDPTGLMTFVELMNAVGLGKILDNMAYVRVIHRWRALQARLCAVTAMLLKPMVIAYSQLKKVTAGLGGMLQAHHVIQDAFVVAQAAYTSGRGLAILLFGGSHMPLSPHDLANKVQAKNAAMRAIDKAWYALRVAGCRNKDATTIVDFVKMDYEIAGIVF